MARKIRFPLKMKNGTDVRTLDELKENFDLESVLGYFTDGRLATWLSDRYYDEKAEAVAALSADMPDLNAKLCEILEVEYEAEADETDVELIARRREKLQIISGVTDNREILDNIDCVAIDQDELFDILDESPERVYLYGDKFEIPFGKKNISYIGVNKPLVVLEKEKGIYLYKENDIKFSNVKFEDNINPYVTSGEKLFLKGNFKEAFPLIKEAAENGNPRAMYIMARYYQDGYETVTPNEQERNNWCEKAYSYKEPLSMYGYAAWCLNDKQDEQNKLYSQIFNDIKFLAESGDALAQGIIGVMYDYGYGVEKDKTKAVEWYRKAAEQGLARDQCNLGYMYDCGYGVEKDKTKAVEWYRKAAEQGYARGQFNLGCMYQYGYGIEKDYKKAVEWYRKAAEQGHARGQFNLGLCYRYGKGVNQDYTQALYWYHKSAEQNYERAQAEIGIFYQYGYGATKDYAEAVKWYRKAAEQGFAFAQCNLGCMYEYGYGVEKDYTKAVEWYRKAAEQGYARGQYKLGSMYGSYYSGIEYDQTKAIEWYRKAAEQGYAEAQARLGDTYASGHGIDRDYTKAVELYRKAAEHGYAYAWVKLGYMYESGYGVEKDYTKAVEWYRKAAEQGNQNGQYALGYMYQEGKGVAQDKSIAIEWYKKAAKQGQTNAVLWLKQWGITI